MSSSFLLLKQTKLYNIQKHDKNIFYLYSRFVVEQFNLFKNSKYKNGFPSIFRIQIEIKY